MNTMEQAWVAGLLEGEGSFVWKPNRGPKVSVEMTDRDIVDRLHRITGVGTVCQPHKRQDHWKQAWVWQVQIQADAADLMVELFPLMGARRREAITEVLSRWKGGKMLPFLSRSRTLD